MKKNTYKEIEKNLNSSIKMKLNQLRTFLDLGKASVMVGAGFSKNAKMGEDIHMKDWGELCEDFYTALYGSKPSDHDFRLKSALRLAQQIESTKGRTALDEIIKNSLPNDSISPGDLHIQLVSLQWRDIFTTNYDSLLEDAAKKAYRHYNVVTSKDSLIYQPHPRIIKLHGSFPDNRPFIITEEDYRTYPERFPEFVNTIRQALIETQFCLIGFSGDDPNFLSWLGWFRDIMGQQMLPIYMIYVGSRPHDSEIKLLTSRKVEPVITADISEDPAEAMDFILSYIGNKFQENKEWSGELNFGNKKSFKESIDKMREIRESYPGWIILPVNRIEHDFSDCRTEFPFMGQSFSELNDKEKLEFLYEYTWRLQISFMPSWINTEWYVNAIQEIVNHYDSINPKDKIKVDYLSVALLQIYRITDDDDFKNNLQLVRNRIPSNNTALHNRIIYEEALWSVSHCELTNLNKILDSWKVSPDDYRGTLWKSRILKEIDKIDEASNILEVSLGNVRRKLITNSKSEYQLSAETLISDCLPYNVIPSKQRKKTDENFHFWRYYDLCKKEITAEEKPSVTHTHGFNIGTLGTSWHSGSSGYIEKYVGAGRYYLLAEAYGQPIGANSMTYNSNLNQLALPLIAEVGLDVALSYLVESNDKNTLNTTLSRQKILNISEKDAIKLFDSWIEVLMPYMESGNKPTWRSREINIVLPILARLCVWLNADRIVLIIKFIQRIYDSSQANLSELLTTCYNSLPIDKAIEVWWSIMENPIVLDYRKCDIPKPHIKIEKWQGTDLTIDIIINGLANKSQDIRRVAVNRFFDIHTILPEEYREKIDHSILLHFDNLLNTRLISFLGISLIPDQDRIWKNKFITHLNSQVAKFQELDFKITGSSAIISNLDNYMVKFIDCYKHITTNQINLITEKILYFININFETLHDTHDSESFLGGMKRFLDSAMNYINRYIERIDCSLIHKGVREELLKKVIALKDQYPLAQAIVNLSFISQSNTFTDDDKATIKQYLKNGITSSDKDWIIDAFSATGNCHRLTNGRFSVQEIVQTAIEKVHYLFNYETTYMLFGFQTWIQSNIIKKQNLKILFEILSSLPQRITKTQDISAELQADLLYYGGQLAACISKTQFNGIDSTECIKQWQVLANSKTIPNDIRNGYLRNLPNNETQM